MRAVAILLLCATASMVSASPQDQAVCEEGAPAHGSAMLQVKTEPEKPRKTEPEMTELEVKLQVKLPEKLPERPKKTKLQVKTEPEKKKPKKTSLVHAPDARQEETSGSCVPSILEAANLQESRECLPDGLQELHLKAIRRHAALLAERKTEVLLAQKSKVSLAQKPRSAAGTEALLSEKSKVLQDPPGSVAVAPVTTVDPLEQFTKTKGTSGNSYCKGGYAQPGQHKTNASNARDCAEMCLADTQCVQFMWHQGNVNAKCRLSYTCLTYDLSKDKIDGYMLNKFTSTAAPTTEAPIQAQSGGKESLTRAPTTTAAPTPAPAQSGGKESLTRAPTTTAAPTPAPATDNDNTDNTGGGNDDSTDHDEGNSETPDDSEGNEGGEEANDSEAGDEESPPNDEAPAPAVSGSTAALTASGFKLVTSLCCPAETEAFFLRLLEQQGLEACSLPHIQGLAHWFTCVPDMDFQYLLDVIANGNPCKYWTTRGGTCDPLSEQCEGKFCR